MVTVHVLDKGVSDHTPLLLDTGEPSYTGQAKQFKMELNWLAVVDLLKLNRLKCANYHFNE